MTSVEPVAVAMDATPLIGVRTGIGVAVAEIMSAFERDGSAVTVVPYVLSLRNRRNREILPSDTRAPRLPARVLLASWKRANRPRIDKFLEPARVLHATNYLAPPSALPTVVSVYDCSFLRNPAWCTPAVRAFGPALKRAVDRGVTIHTASQSVANEIDEYFGPGLVGAGRVAVVPLAAPLPPPAIEPSPLIDELTRASRTVVALGKLEPRKNLPSLVRAFATVAATRPDAKLVIAGPDGPDRPSVHDALAELPPDVRTRVHLVGVLSDADKHALLRAASLVAYPSHYEGFGFPILEAMQAGVPVVATAVGSIPEVAGGAAVLVPAGDEEALAESIGVLLDDPERRHVLAAAGSVHVARFTWEATAQGLVDLYTRLAGEDGGP